MFLGHGPLSTQPQYYLLIDINMNLLVRPIPLIVRHFQDTHVGTVENAVFKNLLEILAKRVISLGFMVKDLKKKSYPVVGTRYS